MELSKNKLGIFSSLSSLKMRRKHSLFIVEGEKAVFDSLACFTPVAVIVRDDYQAEVPADMPLYHASEAEMRRISNLTTPSSIAAIFRIPDQDVDIDSLEISGNELYLLLDGVQDPGNLGTILRTCHWFGVRKIFASRDTADLYNPKTVQATMGSLGRVEVIYCNLADLIGRFPEMPVYGTLLEGKPIYSESFSEGGFIVMGNEGKGISDEIRELITLPLNIPPASLEHGESLNVAIATAVTLSQFRARSFNGSAR